MIKFVTIVLLLASTAQAGYTKLGMASPHGDARFGTVRQVASTNAADNLWAVKLPDGQHEAFTVTGWVRLMYTNRLYLTTSAFWCPEPIQFSNPDLLAGAGGHGTLGTNLTAAGGAITVAAFPWQPYTNAVLSNQYPRGVYTIAGWASNTVTVTLGGTDRTFGPGEFNQNILPGPTASCVISGAGMIAIGISRTPGHRFFTEIDGVEENSFFSKESMISNEIAFVTYRFKSIANGKQIYKSTLGNLSDHNALAQTKTNDMPVARYDSRGLYRVGIAGLGGAADKTFDFFDFRILPWWAADAELQTIWNNGAVEIGRREIPQWRDID